MYIDIRVYSQLVWCFEKKNDCHNNNNNNNNNSSNNKMN